MGFRPCEEAQAPFTREVRQLYRANVVAAPRTGIDPLEALAVRKTKVSRRGRLAEMIDGAAPELPTATPSKAADLQGEYSLTVDVSLGLELTTTFFAALGIPIPSAQATAQLWQGADKIVFEVRDVVQHETDIAELGRVLTGLRIRRNAATDVFFSDTRTRLFIITRTLTSPACAVRATDASGQSIAVDIDGLEDIVGTAKANVSWHIDSSRTISFRGAEPATFAFASVPCVIAFDGTFVFGLETDDYTFGTPATPEMQPIIDRSGLLTFDPDDAMAAG
jgi:hypothetical protein